MVFWICRRGSTTYGWDLQESSQNFLVNPGFLSPGVSLPDNGLGNNRGGSSVRYMYMRDTLMIPDEGLLSQAPRSVLLCEMSCPSACCAANGVTPCRHAPSAEHMRM
jgi:hypothetical protein